MRGRQQRAHRRFAARMKTFGALVALPPYHRPSRRLRLVLRLLPGGRKAAGVRTLPGMTPRFDWQGSVRARRQKVTGLLMRRKLGAPGQVDLLRLDVWRDGEARPVHRRVVRPVEGDAPSFFPLRGLPSGIYQYAYSLHGRAVASGRFLTPDPCATSGQARDLSTADLTSRRLRAGRRHRLRGRRERPRPDRLGWRLVGRHHGHDRGLRRRVARDRRGARAGHPSSWSWASASSLCSPPQPPRGSCAAAVIRPLWMNAWRACTPGSTPARLSYGASAGTADGLGYRPWTCTGRGATVTR